MKRNKILLLGILLLSACGGNNNSSQTQSSILNQSSENRTTSNSSSFQSSENSIIDNSSSIHSSSSSYEPKEFLITWKDENGELLGQTNVLEGEIPSYSYSKEDTKEWNYTFEGWSTTLNGDVIESLPSASSNETYYAVVSKVKQKYTITFVSNGGSKVENITNNYGSIIEEPTKPKYEGYRFTGWCSDVSLETKVSWPLTLTDNITLYASWNEQVDITAYLQELLDGYNANPYSYIPESMHFDYEDNLIDESDIIDNYDNSVQTKDIISNGFGEQWNMVDDNLNESMKFFNVLTIVETLTTSSVLAFNNYLDKNPGDTANYKFKESIYNVTINFDGSTIYYVLDYETTLPIFGEQTVQIALSMNIGSKEKNVRVQLGDANALTYNISENSYDFAIKYLGIRTAYFSVSQDEDGLTTGHIYEYLTVSGIGLKSAADFYITDDYVSVVGNKADALTGFKGYINEVYEVETGKLLGFEVKEELSVLKFNTLFFDLNNLSGINSIRSEIDEENNDVFYVNNSSKAWESKNVSIINSSRRFDLEFRSQYFYSYDSINQEYVKHEVKVPMLFVQEEYFDTLVKDVENTNDIVLDVILDDEHLQKIMDEYDANIDVFIENKEKISEDYIREYIGEKVSF